MNLCSAFCEQSKVTQLYIYCCDMKGKSLCVCVRACVCVCVGMGIQVFVCLCICKENSMI